MGWLFRTGWHLALFCALLGVLGGPALVLAFASMAGPSIGQGAYGAKTVAKGIGEGWSDMQAYDDALSEAKANQAAKEQAAKDKRAAAKKKAQGGS